MPDGVEGAGVQITSLSAEVFPLTRHRPWFEQELQQYYETLSRAGDDADIFVLGFVCSATPKSPDPDPALFR